MDSSSDAPGRPRYRKFYEHLTRDLCEAVRIEARYNTHDHNQQTRAERNYLARHVEPGFEVRIFKRENGEEYALAVPDVPEDGRGLWAAFWALSRHRNEREPLHPSMILDWCRLHGATIPTLAAQIIDVMDRRYLAALAEEIAANQARITK